MTRPGPPVLGKTEILNHLAEVADELTHRDVVDSLTKLTDELKDVVRRVGERHGLRATWLNDSATMFAPDGLDLDDCELLYEHGNLTVLGPPPEQVFLMKLLASRAPDHDDMTMLWPRCRFADAQAAVDAIDPLAAVTAARGSPAREEEMPYGHVLQ